MQFGAWNQVWLMAGWVGWKPAPTTNRIIGAMPQGFRPSPAKLKKTPGH
jgi:hypothetical protein